MWRRLCALGLLIGGLSFVLLSASPQPSSSSSSVPVSVTDEMARVLERAKAALLESNKEIAMLSAQSTKHLLIIGGLVVADAALTATLLVQAIKR